MRKAWTERITVDPNVCHGAACVKGTRIPVSVILDNRAANISEKEIVRQYPALTADDLRAAMAVSRDHM